VIAKLPIRVPEHRDKGRRGCSARGQDADAMDLPRLLRSRSEWHKSETNSESDREADQPQRHLGGGWLAGV